jgi:hypothetical protein
MALSNNTFKECKSQQGGALYIMSVQSLVLENNNTFTKNTAVLYPSELKITPITDFPLRNKKFEIVSDQLHMGKGPVIYFNCSTAIGCTLDI